MITKGMSAYFIEDGHIYEGAITDIEQENGKVTFQIDTYGTCEGLYRIDEKQIGRTIFLDKEDAMRHLPFFDL